MSSEPHADWNPDACNERAGFLFAHPCHSPPLHPCAACGKPVCQQHTHYLDNEPHCTACAKQDQRRRKSAVRGRRAEAAADDYGDPYFYSDDYYHGYGRYRPGYWGSGYYAYHSMHGGDQGAWDDSDFTSGDAESLQREGHEDFESDLSES